MLFRPSESSKKIVDFYRRYMLTTFSTNNEKYNAQLKEALEKEGAIAEGPYLSMSDPYEKGSSLKELADEGLLSKDILNIQGFHPERSLYRHQEEAVRKSIEGKNLIVTTGTGSGKTESFLIPVINQLLKEKEAGTLGPGVRTLIIYPMNALVNDQIRRLRELLAGMEGEPKITFGRFTGETQETFREAKAKYEEVEDILVNPLCENELISREQMRATPPNILITNYAMLEYMLLRPGDNIIFSEENSRKWQHIVFDEAHSYSGSKGIEVASLIKRVKAMLRRDDIKFILTSATLGNEKLNDEIIHFGEALCTAKFESSGIVRSHTVEVKPEHDVTKINFELYKELATMIRDHYMDSKIVETIRKYGVEIENGKELSEILFDIILHDSFYFDVRRVLFNQIKTVTEVASELQITVDDLTDFIAVASNAVKDNERLFEAKYHMFLRGIEGVYVTLSPSYKLFVNRMETYKEKPYDESYVGYKVFEISFCNNCNALYITGEEIEGYLVQKSKFNDDYNPEVYLLSGDFDDDDNDENSYHICSKCGAIKRATSVNGLQCGHGTKYVNKLIKVKKRGEKLHSCSCCHSVNGQRSILRPYFLGTEAATAVIATALYNELPGEEHHIEVTTIEDDFFGDDGEQIVDHKDSLVKQFLAFSDNRQTAAFFATYLQSTYQDSLIKRIIKEIVDENREHVDNGISLNYFISLLGAKFQKYQVFSKESEDMVIKEAWIHTLKEISNFKARNSLMKTGIMMFDVDFNIPTPKNLGLSAEETTLLFKNLTKSMMKDAALSIETTLTKADVGKFTVTGFQKGYDQVSSGLSYIEGWCPEQDKTNKRLKYVTKVLGGDEVTARRLLESIWRYMGDKKNEYILLQSFGKRKAYVLNSKKIKAKTVKKLFICSECKNITPYSVRGICDNPKCNGYLEEYDYMSVLKDNHYYNLFTNLEISPMSVHEHTAQLSSDRAYEYQKEFKDKKINVLSCSTTFEMGVDVGSLETVFMRNMPPSPANYAQRAGRAGRSLKSAAYAITFCPNSSHDLNYYKNPVSMIKGSINPPFFNVSNDKIVLRHIFASAFSFFWKIYQELYKETIGEFIECDGFKRLHEFLNMHPENLRSYLLNVVPKDLQNFFGIKDYSWVSLLFSEDEGAKGYCNLVIDKYEDDITALEKAKVKLIEENKNGVDRITRSIRTIKDQRIIEFLSKNNLIPKYGFPVDTVELQGGGINSANSNLRLNRDLFTAISEYAPESEVVADGNLIKSRYVRKLPGYEWPKYNYAKCPECLTLNRTLSIHRIKKCRCGKELNGRGHQYIIPQFGFQMDTEGMKPVGLNKPERTYKGSVSYIGDENKIEFHEYNICGRQVLLGNSKMDSLAVLNESSFYVCETCGYGKVYEKATDRIVQYNHENPNGYKCASDKLVSYALGHELQTDVVLLKFLDCEVYKQDEAWTILYSMLEGLSRTMNIDRNELSGCLQWYRENDNTPGNFGFVLFDNTPGGAGYVRKLIEPTIFANMLREAFYIVSNCECGGEAADTACYSCLCNYYNQKQHDILKRKYAVEFFQQFSLSYKEEWPATRNAEIYVKPVVETVPQKIIKEVFVNTKEHFQLEYGDDGQNQESETAEEIWDNLFEDCYTDAEQHLIAEIKSRNIVNIVKPVYQQTIKILETGEKIYTDLIWRSKKVMLFLDENKDSYEIARKTGWYCYCTSEAFDIDEFLERIQM